MSRKALFANLGSSENEDKLAEQAGSSGSTNSLDRGAADRPGPHDYGTRPILGAPELLRDPSTAPVGALGQSLSEFKAQSDRAAAIERRLAEGQVIVELDPALIDPSFVLDRMAVTMDAHAKLVEAIREHGQQVPILVRPHPSDVGRYQVAYGHRRLRAAAELKRTVRAVVKNSYRRRIGCRPGSGEQRTTRFVFYRKIPICKVPRGAWFSARYDHDRACCLQE